MESFQFLIQARKCNFKINIEIWYQENKLAIDKLFDIFIEECYKIDRKLIENNSNNSNNNSLYNNFVYFLYNNTLTFDSKSYNKTIFNTFS
jgi:hypothetical protein